MINTILCDFSWVILFPKDKNYQGALNQLHFKLAAEHGDYDLYNYFKFNEELLDFYQSLKEKCSLNIFTTGVLQNHPQAKLKLEPIFEHIFSAYNSELDKSNPDSYLSLAKRLGKQPAEILFIDDQEKFIDAAKKAGFNTIQYKNNQELIKEIKKFIK